MRIFCSPKDCHIFQKKNSVFVLFVFKITNDVVNFEQPAPGDFV